MNSRMSKFHRDRSGSIHLLRVAGSGIVEILIVEVVAPEVTVVELAPVDEPIAPGGRVGVVVGMILPSIVIEFESPANSNLQGLWVVKNNLFPHMWLETLKEVIQLALGAPFRHVKMELF